MTTGPLQYDPETGAELVEPDVSPEYRHDWGAGQSTVMGPLDVVPRGREETASEYLERMAKRTDSIARAQQAERRAARRVRARRWAVEVITSVLQLAGLALVSYGLFTWTPWVGIVVGGLSLILISVALDPPKRRISIRNPLAGAALPVPAPLPERHDA